jgi:hypothetical protein
MLERSVAIVVEFVVHPSKIAVSLPMRLIPQSCIILVSPDPLSTVFAVSLHRGMSKASSLAIGKDREGVVK